VNQEQLPESGTSSSGFDFAAFARHRSAMRTLAEDTSPEAEAVLIGLLRKASPARKFQMIVSANLLSRDLALVGLKSRHPHDSPSQLRRRLADLWLGPDLAAKAYGPPASHVPV
jgi:hypothetical protein